MYFPTEKIKLRTVKASIEKLSGNIHCIENVSKNSALHTSNDSRLLVYKIIWFSNMF